MRKIDSDFDERIKNIISGMSLSDKINSLSAGPVPGQPEFTIGGEGAHGVQARHDQHTDLGSPEYTTVFPNPIGMSSTWDVQLIETIGDIVGTEARALYNEGLNQNLCLFAPTVDLERDPRWGRNEEGYGEDPYLASEMAGHYILGMKGNDKKYVRCGATLKHFYSNNTENGRFYKNNEISDRLKWEYYLDVFRRVANKYSPEGIMTAYNFINGVPGLMNPEIREIADEWNITYTISDGMALHFLYDNTDIFEDHKDIAVRAVKAGLDIFTDDNTPLSAYIREAVEKGLITEEELDKCIYNKLAVIMRLGIYDRSSDDFPYGKTEYNMNAVCTAKSKEISRRAVAEGTVLLKNKDAFLPIGENEKIAVLGIFADRCPMDWYSGIPEHMVTLAEGIKGNDTEDRVVFDDILPEVIISTGEGRYLGLSDEAMLIDIGNPVLYTKADPSLNRNAYRLIETDREHAESFKLMLWNKSRITLRSMSTGKLLSTRRPEFLKERPKKPFTSGYLYSITEEVFSWFGEEVLYLADEKGEILSFDESDCSSFYSDSRIKRLLLWNKKSLKRSEDGFIVYDDDEENEPLDISFELVTSPQEKLIGISSKGYSKAVMAFGIHPMIESREDYDRDGYELSPYQRYLANLITQYFDDTVLVLLSGAPVGISTENTNKKIKAILWSALGSSELGNGIADIIYGRKNPSGRTNMTWYKSETDLPSIDDYDIIGSPRTYIYYEGDVLYPFGYGLGYSEIRTGGLTASYDPKEKVFNVELTVENKGTMTADHVLPVYFKKNDIQKKLCFFTKLHDIKPGQSISLSFAIPDDNFRLYDENSKKMSFGIGIYKIIVENNDYEVVIS